MRRGGGGKGGGHLLTSAGLLVVILLSPHPARDRRWQPARKGKETKAFRPTTQLFVHITSHPDAISSNPDRRIQVRLSNDGLFLSDGCNTVAMCMGHVVLLD